MRRPELATNYPMPELKRSLTATAMLLTFQGGTCCTQSKRNNDMPVKKDDNWTWPTTRRNRTLQRERKTRSRTDIYTSKRYCQAMTSMQEQKSLHACKTRNPFYTYLARVSMAALMAITRHVVSTYQLASPHKRGGNSPSVVTLASPNNILVPGI